MHSILLRSFLIQRKNSKKSFARNTASAFHKKRVPLGINLAMILNLMTEVDHEDVYLT